MSSVLVADEGGGLSRDVADLNDDTPANSAAVLTKSFGSYAPGPGTW